MRGTGLAAFKRGSYVNTTQYWGRFYLLAMRFLAILYFSEGLFYFIDVNITIVLHLFSGWETRVISADWIPILAMGTKISGQYPGANINIGAGIGK